VFAIPDKSGRPLWTFSAMRLERSGLARHILIGCKSEFRFTARLAYFREFSGGEHPNVRRHSSSRKPQPMLWARVPAPSLMRRLGGQIRIGLCFIRPTSGAWAWRSATGLVPRHQRNAFDGLRGRWQ